MHVEKGKYYRDGNGRVIGPLMFTGDGDFLHLVAEVYVSDTPPAERDALRAENEKLRELLRDIIKGWDWWSKDEYNRCQSVPGDAIENARAALGEKE